VYNCPNTENTGSIKFISGSATSPDMNFIDPIFFRIRTIVYCVTNNMVTTKNQGWSYVYVKDNPYLNGKGKIGVIRMTNSRNRKLSFMTRFSTHISLYLLKRYKSWKENNYLIFAFFLFAVINEKKIIGTNLIGISNQ
jgi:hypothetical protein